MGMKLVYGAFLILIDGLSFHQNNFHTGACDGHVKKSFGAFYLRRFVELSRLFPLSVFGNYLLVEF